jgi:hypothetical protein
MAEIRRRSAARRGQDAVNVLELRLNSGQVVSFDGRVLEIFGERGPSGRFHVAQLTAVEPVEAADGARTLVLEGGAAQVSFAREESPACTRLVTAIADARQALTRADP